MNTSFFTLESTFLAPYAFHSEQTAGRRHPEQTHSYRGPYQRDRDRIVHCAAFRRLSEKTQVFTIDFGNYHRTRLTHTLEVTNVARTLARSLRLNEDLAEALGLLHDVGHPPFGHTGEDALDDLTREVGGFSHNMQALRIVEKLEMRYPHIPGLNLSEEVLLGQKFRYLKKSHAIPAPLLEVQVVDAADSISYGAHDADDALELGFLSLDDLAENALWRIASKRVDEKYSDLDTHSFRDAVVRELIDRLVGDVLRQSERNIEESGISTAAEAVEHPILIKPGAEIEELKAELGAFLFERVYRHPKVLTYRRQVRVWLNELYDYFTKNPDRIPERYAKVMETEGLERMAADYLSDMTDRSAKLEYLRLVDDRKTVPRSPIEMVRDF